MKTFEGGRVSLSLLPSTPSSEPSQTSKLLACHRHGDGAIPVHGSRKKLTWSMSMWYTTNELGCALKLPLARAARTLERFATQQVTIHVLACPCTFFHFLSFSFIFSHFLLFSLIFIHFLLFSFIFLHFPSFSFIFLHFPSFSFIFFHFLSSSFIFFVFVGCSKSDFFRASISLRFLLTGLM